MSKTAYEIRIVEKEKVTFITKYLTKNNAINHYEKVSQFEEKPNFPLLLLSEINYDCVGNQISSNIILKRCVNLKRINLETAKTLLSQ